jgi:lipoyl(octanoyl) transferase
MKPPASAQRRAPARDIASQSRPFSIDVRDLGRMAYAEAFALQKQLQQEVIAQRANPTGWQPRTLGYLLLVEHDPPVITVSRRKTARQHLIASPQQLEHAGVEIAETDRGGDITYHGPGQLVVYPIIDLNLLGLRIHGYMRLLEQVVINTLAHFGINADRDESATGVWVSIDSKAHGLPSVGNSAKICAMGVRVSRWVSMHGLALNVSTNLQHFQLIVPCGLAGRPVTSMEQMLGEACPTMDDVKREMVEQFHRGVDACVASPP